MEGEEGGPTGWGGVLLLFYRPWGGACQALGSTALADGGFWRGTEAHPRGWEVGIHEAPVGQ